MKKNNLRLIGVVVVVVIAALAMCSCGKKELTIENALCYVGEPMMPSFEGEGLDANAIDSIEYSYESELVTIDEDSKIVAQDDGEAFPCTMTIKSGKKTWEGEFYINTTYKELDFKNGDTPLGANAGSCPLKITNPEIGEKCYVYLKNNGSGNDYAVMIEGESSISKKIAAGSYTMYVAFGYTTQGWYGPTYLFGKDGNGYYKRAEALDFSVSSRAYNGYNMTITSNPGGQVDLESISYEEFPGK